MLWANCWAFAAQIWSAATNLIALSYAGGAI